MPEFKHKTTLVITDGFAERDQAIKFSGDVGGRFITISDTYQQRGLTQEITILPLPIGSEQIVASESVAIALMDAGDIPRGGISPIPSGADSSTQEFVIYNVVSCCADVATYRHSPLSIVSEGAALESDTEECVGAPSLPLFSDEVLEESHDTSSSEFVISIDSTDMLLLQSQERVVGVRSPTSSFEQILPDDVFSQETIIAPEFSVDVGLFVETALLFPGESLVSDSTSRHQVEGVQLESVYLMLREQEPREQEVTEQEVGPAASVVAETLMGDYALEVPIFYHTLDTNSLF